MQPLLNNWSFISPHQVSLICQIQPKQEQQKPEQSQELTVFPVGLNIGKRNVIQTLLVRGKEDGLQAINFESWLVPYDAIVQALKLDIKPLPDGQLEVRSPGLVIRINPNQLRNDPELGLVFSIKELQTLFGVPAEFNINEYAIVLNPPWLEDVPGIGIPGITTSPVQIEGLPKVTPSPITLTAIGQRTTLNGLNNHSNLSTTSTRNYRGELAVVGTLLSGSWYFRINQDNLLDLSTWNLAEAQYLRQTDPADYAIGSQTTFWRTQSLGDYWGFTTIQRQGFTPPKPFGGAGGFIPTQRLQASQIGRSIVGQAEPGTLVRLTQGFSDRAIAEVLVDSSGIYRFEDVQIGDVFFGNYRVLLYPEGRLSAQPEIREPTFSTVPGQIPQGASATLVSGGFRREFSSGQNQNFLGEFTNFQGGILQRWGVREDLTVGIGGIYDQTPKGLAELFFQPQDIPLEVAASVLTPDENSTWDVDANIRYRPSSSVNFQFFSDRFSQRLNFDWKIFTGVTLLGIYNSRDGAALGVQTSLSGRGWFTFARATFDRDNRLRWNAIQRLGRLEFTQQGNEIGIRSVLNYNLSSSTFLDTGHSLLLSYETRNLNQADRLAVVGWSYRSQNRLIDGTYLWDASVGYGLGSQGSGLIATLQTAAIPGLLLRARYEGISVTSNQATYTIELVSSLNLQRGIRAGDRRSDRFRTEGGLWIQPFLDKNNNGEIDRGEEIYTKDPKLLLVINNQSIESFRPEVFADRILLTLPPGTYRLDLDPAGLPVDWQASVEALAVEVVAGSYTIVKVPLIQSYTISGVVTNAQGEVIPGARVEAIQTESGQRRFSVTNGAGVYYLERLQRGTYTLQINGKTAQPNSITLNESSEPFQELNLQPIADEQ